MKSRSKRARLSVLAAVCLRAGAAAGGPGIVGNSGDSVLCEASGESAFSGRYALDFLLTYEGTDNRGVSDVASWEESRDRIQGLLDARSPDLAASFRAFAGSVGRSDLMALHTWRAAPFGVAEVGDEQMIRRLPPNCYDSMGGKARVVQAVLQLQRPEMITYDYDPEIFEDLRQRAPLQFSFLMVHEWLWEWSDDVRVVRDANHFLHSQAAAALGQVDFETSLVRMGLVLKPFGFKPACDRPDAIRQVLEAITGKGCDGITAQDLAPPVNGRGLHIVDRSLRWPMMQDFSGIQAVHTVEIRDAGLQQLFDHSFDAFGRSLERVDLSHNELGTVPGGIFRGRDIAFVDLSFNRLRSLPANFMESHFWAICQPEGSKPRIDLSHNRLNSLAIDPNVPRPYRYPSIDVSYNELTNLDPSFCQLLCHDERIKTTLLTRGNPLAAGAAAAFEDSCPGARVVP